METVVTDVGIYYSVNKKFSNWISQNHNDLDSEQYDSIDITLGKVWIYLFFVPSATG